MSAQSKMTSARTSLVLEQPFYGALALSLHLKEDPTCETAWVDGRTLGYNPSFVSGLNHDECTALVGHEVSHCALGHPWRRDARNPKSWNVACDKAINHDLQLAGFKLPDGALFPVGDEVGKSSEWIFSHANHEDKPQDGDGQGNGPDPLGEVRDAPTGPDEDGEPAPSEQDWKQKVNSAMVQAKLQGKMPGSLARAVQQALRPKVDIRSLLLRFFSERSTGDYSWTRPNSRYIAHGLYLPALESKDLGEVSIMVDTSGSIDEVALTHARGIVESVIEECSPSAVTVYYADADVCRVDRFEKGEPLTWQPKGGGGTDFRPVLQAIEEAENAVCAVCITDLEGTFPESSPSLPVLWLATKEHIAPFGETVPVWE